MTWADYNVDKDDDYVLWLKPVPTLNYLEFWQNPLVHSLLHWPPTNMKLSTVLDQLGTVKYWCRFVYKISSHGIVSTQILLFGIRICYVNWFCADFCTVRLIIIISFITFVWPNLWCPNSMICEPLFLSSLETRCTQSQSFNCVYMIIDDCTLIAVAVTRCRIMNSMW